MPAAYDLSVQEALMRLKDRWLDEGVKPERTELESLFESHGLDPLDPTIALVVKFMMAQEALDMNELEIVMRSAEDGFDPAIVTVATLRVLRHEEATGRLRAVRMCQRRLALRPEEEALLMELADSDDDLRVREEAKLALAMHGLF